MTMTETFEISLNNLREIDKAAKGLLLKYHSEAKNIARKLVRENKALNNTDAAIYWNDVLELLTITKQSQ